jgi:hypothetical protein
MKQENVDIQVGSKFDAKGFKQAETALGKLTKTVKSAAGALGIAYGARAITQFGIAAAKAFAEDEAAALRLQAAVNNLGISFANPQIAQYISELENTAKIADDVLRPAFQGLLTTTGSLTQSQKLLNDAITISRGTGIELATVAQDLANGYIGITKGLKKYNSGLTTSELSTKSFSDVLGILLGQSAGAADAYLDTTSFKFDALTIATDNAREMIGKGLVDALARVSGGTEATDATKTIDLFAASIYQLEVRLGGAIGAIPTLLNKLKSLPKEIFMGFAGKSFGVNLTPQIDPKTKPPLSKTAQQKALEKLEKDAAARNKKLIDMQNKAAKEALAKAREKAALDKANSLFDLQQTQILAALKGNITDEERKRLELQLAIVTGSTSEASKLAGELAKSQGLSKELAAYLASLPAAKNPFEAWKAYLDAIETQARRIANITPIAPVSIAGGNTSGTYSPAVQSMIAATTPSVGVTSGGDVVINIAGSVVSEADLVEAVSNGLLNRSLSGSPSSIGRLKGSFQG